jgi:hypothetical protein
MDTSPLQVAANALITAAIAAVGVLIKEATRAPRRPVYAPGTPVRWPLVLLGAVCDA